MSGIRVTYSGLIAFVVGLSGIFTGLVFTIIMTRELSQEEFGTWNLIGSMLGYTLIFGPVVNFWTTREIARGNKPGKTALFSNVMFSIAAVIIYLVLTVFFSDQVQVSQSVLLFSAILVPAELIRRLFNFITLGHRPQAVEYGVMVSEITKIVAALVFVYFLGEGLTGIILSVLIATVANIIMLVGYSSNHIKGKFDKDLLKRWIKLFWIPTFPNIKPLITNSDIVVFTIIMGGVEPVAFWGAARAVSKTVGNARNINKALYPKLLAGGKKKLFGQNLTILLYFAFPLMAMALVFARPGLFILNPDYVAAETAVFLLAFVFFLRVLSEVSAGSLKGIEKVDASNESTMRDYIKSKLFYLPTLGIIQRSLYVGALVVVLIIIKPLGVEPVQAVTYWALIALVTQIPYTAYLLVLAKRSFQFKLEKASLLKYLVAAITVFGVTFFVMRDYLVYSISIFEFGPDFLPYIILSISSYLGLTYLLDKKTRYLFKQIISEIKKDKQT